MTAPMFKEATSAQLARPGMSSLLLKTTASPSVRRAPSMTQPSRPLSAEIASQTAQNAKTDPLARPLMTASTWIPQGPAAPPVHPCAQPASMPTFAPHANQATTSGRALRSAGTPALIGGTPMTKPADCAPMAANPALQPQFVEIVWTDSTKTDRSAANAPLDVLFAQMSMSVSSAILAT